MTWATYHPRVKGQPLILTGKVRSVVEWGFRSLALRGALLPSGDHWVGGCLPGGILRGMTGKPSPTGCCSSRL